MEQRCVYILQGTRYYVGSTNDIERRLAEHKSKGYSSNRIGDWKLVKKIPCESRIAARRLELRIKKGGYIERWIIQYS